MEEVAGKSRYMRPRCQEPPARHICLTGGGSSWRVILEITLNLSSILRHSVRTRLATLQPAARGQG
jgi:hypothetical protein